MEKRLFEINDEASDFLKQLQGPLGIISVAGMYRTGKSYLLNRMLLNRQGGFGVGPTINPCTKGVWIWGKPISGYTPDGEQIQVLVLDTEGLGALDEDSNHDVRIFSLAILLSSFFIYNSVGSIDENALQNLSLVINLTKHIHLKSTGLQEDVDPEEYSQYFPSFMWVVRDFTLQLLDLDGEQITTKEYLEKALQPQKGFTDAIEQKNRIRRLLKSFFLERDCVTMIRPLTKEENLQSLDKLALDELRPEFVEQINVLRRKVIHRIKPKLMHGKKLNGEMLFNLALNYVNSINKGVVPNIESAWSYICKNECQRAQMESFEKFENDFIEKYNSNQPVFDEELKEMYQEAKKIALDDFSKLAVGEVKLEFLHQLKEKMRNKYLWFKGENAKLAEQSILMFLQQNYSDIERNLKNQQYSNIYDLVEELNKFKMFFIENGPPGPNRMTVLMEFINKCLTEAAEFMFRHQENELKLEQNISQDKINKLQSSLTELKEEHTNKINNFEMKLRNNEIEKAEFAAKEQSTREALTQKTKEFQQLENDMNERVDQLKKERTRELEESRNMVHQSEENAKEMQRQKLASESEHEKLKALQDQKISFFEKQLEDAQKKEKELNNELKGLKRDHLNSQKDSQKMYDQQLRDLQKKNEEMAEKVYDWENKFQELESKNENEIQKFEEQEMQQKRELMRLREQNNELMKSNDHLKKSYQQDVEKLKVNSEETNTSQNEKILELESAKKNLEEQIEILQQKWEKDQAIFKQKNEFFEVQLKEEKQRLEKQREDHEVMLQRIQTRERESVIGKEDSQKRMQAMREQFNQECQDVQTKYETEKNKMQTQIDQLTDRNQELEISLKIQVGDYEKALTTLRENLKLAEEQRNKAQEQVRSLDTQKLKQMEDLDSQLKEKESEWESEMQTKVDDYEKELKEQWEKSQETIQQFRSHFDTEKDRLERRYQEEKERAQRRYNNMVDDYEQKIKDEINQKDMEIESKQEEWNQIQNEFQTVLQQLQHDNSLKEQQIQSLEIYLQETKESLDKLQSTNSLTLEKQLEKFDDERRQLTNKVEKKSQELASKEREITALQNQKESLINQIQQKDKVIGEMRNEHGSEKGDLQTKIDQTRLNHQEALDQLTQKRIEFERDKALRSQQLQFQEQRINELTRQQEETIKRYEERIKFDREEMQKDTQEKIQRIQEEKEKIETKYDEKRKALKDLDSSTSKQIGLIERDRSVLQEKCQNLEMQNRDQQKQFEIELNNLQKMNEQLNSSLNSDKQAIHVEVEKWRQQYQDMEKNLQEQINQYDKDKCLWENKHTFVQAQLETSRKENQEATKKFQSILEQQKKMEKEEKKKASTTHQSELIQIEAKFNQKLKENIDLNEKKAVELKQQNKDLQKQNQILTEKLSLTSNSNRSDYIGLEKKLEKTQDENNRLEQQMSELKTERDKVLEEYKSKMQKEKENWKKKVQESEQKATRVESRQNELMVKFEKEKIELEQQCSELRRQKEDWQDNQERLDKKVEQLLRENEKLKNENKNKKNLYQASQATTNYQAAMVGNKFLNQMQQNYGLNKNTQGSTTGLGAIGGLSKFGGQGDGSDTQRTNIASGYTSYLNREKGTEKSFTSGGAVGGLNQSQLEQKQGNPLENSLMKNILLSTPSSKKSDFNEEDK